MPRFAVELEGGAVWQSRNVVEIPNDGTATRISLVDLAGKGPWPVGRMYPTWNTGGRHGLRLLAAPFSITETGMPDAPLRFAGASYAAGSPVTATYTFNSYRLSYRYSVHQGARATAWMGFTGKVRDAEIALEQGATSSRKTDLGFVPLLHLAGDWTVAPRWHAGIDVDGLAGGPGRAVDAALTMGYDGGGPWMIKAGYRQRGDDRPRPPVDAIGVTCRAAGENVFDRDIPTSYRPPGDGISGAPRHVAGPFSIFLRGAAQRFSGNRPGKR